MKTFIIKIPIIYMSLHVSALRGHFQRLNSKRNLFVIVKDLRIISHTVHFRGAVPRSNSVPLNVSNRTARHVTSSNNKVSVRQYTVISATNKLANGLTYTINLSLFNDIICQFHRITYSLRRIRKKAIVADPRI